jgi:P27 family predicted phage terminase small subunit
MRGRKPVPTALRVLRGNPSKRPLPVGPTAPGLPADTPAPTWLEPAARREWERLAPILAGAGLLTALTAPALAVLCVETTVWQSARARMRKKGHVVAGEKSPYIAIAQQALGNVLKLYAEFGMTPMAVSRVTTTAPAVTPDNPLQKFLR